MTCITDLSKTFNMKSCWNLSKAFSASREMILILFCIWFGLLWDCVCLLSVCLFQFSKVQFTDRLAVFPAQLESCSENVPVLMW